MSQKTKVRILWLKPTKGQVSIGRYLLAEELEKLGYKIKIIESSRLGVIKALYFGLFSDYDLIVGGVRVGAYIGYILSKIKRRPIVVDVTDPYHQVSYLPRIFYHFFKKYEEYVLKSSDAVIFVTKNYMLELLSKGIYGTKVNNGVKFEMFAKPSRKSIEFARNILVKKGVNTSNPIILYVGGLIDAYNIDVILNAAEKLKDFNFVFIGEGYLKKRINEKSKKCKNIFYLGTFNHNMIPGFVKLSDICLCLVNADQPLKLLEYGAARKPVIAVHGELEDRFTNREIYFINPNVDELCRAISELVDNVKLRKRFGIRLKRRALLYRWSEIARKYDKVFRNLMGRQI